MSPCSPRLLEASTTRGASRLRAARSHVVALLAAAALGACGSRDVQERLFADAAAIPDGPLFATTVHVPASLTSILGTTRDLHGRPSEVLCATCHEGMSPAPRLPDAAERLGGPHAGLVFRHGTNACRSCHDPDHYDRLRLATGDTIPMVDAIRLCSQCHGPQARDYANGSHGGNSGYWDLRRGPRLRNHCADCHDPHAPRFPVFRPAPPPLDAPALHGADHG